MDMLLFTWRKAKLFAQMLVYQFHRFTFGLLRDSKISQTQVGVVSAVALGIIVKFGIMDTTRGHRGIFPFMSSSRSNTSSMFGLAPAAPSMLNEADVKRYVAEYQNIAIKEMHQFGIPASVSMAQGLIESRCGESSLSTKNNNHFGLKCFSKNCKKGHCSNFTDDSHKDFFKKFGSPTDSWREHSLLLTQGRYKSLHDLDKDNFEAWANGLQRLGYATDNDYANKLITIIEQYNLSELDSE
jgi:flagellum-specific peptidoglycan hydrolase FlgJ